MQNTGVRINKYLSEAGICSRREADRRIEAGEVRIEGKVAEMGDRVMPGEHVLCQGVEATSQHKMVLLAVNKPVGIVCTAEKREKNNIVDYIHYPVRIYPVGRLDKDSEGLILMTNNGDIVNKMMRSGNMHEKEYVVTVDREVTDSFLHGMENGVPLRELNTTTRKCRTKKLGKHQFTIILTQGLNRQIRRMCEYFGYRVKKLERIRVMNIELGDLQTGKYREVTEREWETLNKMIQNSSNQPVIPREKPNSPANEKAEGIGYAAKRKNRSAKRKPGIS